MAYSGRVEERLLAPQEDEGNLKARLWVESKKIWRVTFSAILSRVTSFGMFVVTQAFIGHIGNTELAAYAITQIIGLRFANGLILGMSCATETLCGQAFGAKQYHMLGIYLQRSWIITVATATLLVPVFVFISPIFKLLGEEDEIADTAGYISLWFIPIIYGFAFNCTAQNYLQSQVKNKIVAWLSSISFALHIVLSWLFVSIFDWGIPGAMSALIISNWLVTIGELVYIFGGWLYRVYTHQASSSIGLHGVKHRITKCHIVSHDVLHDALGPFTLMHYTMHYTVPMMSHDVISSVSNGAYTCMMHDTVYAPYAPDACLSDLT